MGNLYRWCLVGFLFAVFLSLSARAETIPATQANYATAPSTCWNYVNGSCSSSTVTGSDAASLCSTLWTKNKWTTGLNPVVSSDKTSVVCGYYSGTNRYGYKICPTGYGASASSVGATPSETTCFQAQVTYSCPSGQNWTLNGQSCTRPDCAIGFDRNSQGHCVRDCTGKAGQPTANGNYSFSGGVSTWSVSECKVNCVQRVLTAYGGTGYQCKYTGASADPEVESGKAEPPDPEKLPPEKPDDCLSRGSGYVQSSTGKITCVPSSEAPEGQKPNKKEADNVKESGTKKPDGTLDKTSPDYKKEETSTSQGSDGTTTTNKTETVAGTNDGNGNVTCPTGYTKNPDNTCSKTTTTQQTNSGFCEQNPNSPLCKEAKESRFGGGCDSGFVCEGDAATCASARASHELKCSFQPDSTTGLHDSENPGGTGSQVAKAAEALNADGTKDFNIASEFSSKNQQWVNFSSGCPVGVQQFSILGKTLEVDASIVCDIGLFIRLMVHIVAYLGLARVFATKLV